MAAEHQYFYEDEVFRINKKGNIEFGMVLENSELVSSDENSDGEDGGRMKQGHIRVAWHPTGEEEVIQEKKQRRAALKPALMAGGTRLISITILFFIYVCKDGGATDDVIMRLNHGHKRSRDAQRGCRTWKYYSARE
ncbi:E2/E3 hybrid ubiquitin-protein ligase ube2o [Homalodisca vitripennis]|nr:E2/E3 hybrid ubiquitin-protein ligase ube2o [Homalodisca vitripennis]